MSVTDPIADMLTRIRNASRAKYRRVDMPASKIKTELARVLLDEGFINEYKVVKKDEHDTLRISIKYDVDGKTPIIRGLKRISSPGLRNYRKCREIPKVLGGMGIAILSTPSGILTGKQAASQNVGGELLCYVW